MPLYKAFLKVFLRRMPSIAVYFGIFMLIALLMSMNGEENSGFKARQLNIAVYDMDESESSRQLVNYLGANHKLVGGIKNSDHVIQDALYNGTISAAVIIDEGFEEKLEGGDFDGLYEMVKPQNSYNTTLLEGQMTQFVKLAGIKMAGGSGAAEACRQSASVCSKHIKVDMADSGKKEASTFGYFTQYLAYIFICILIVGIAPCIMRLRGTNLRKRILCAPLSPSAATFQMGLGVFTAVAGVWIAFMIVASLFFGKDMYGWNGMLCMLNSLCYIIMAAGLTLLVAQFDLNDNSLSMVSNVISLGMSFLCGVFVPQEVMGDGVLKVAHVLPAYWYVTANDVLCGFSDAPFKVSSYLLCLGVQLAMGAVLFAAAGILASRRKK